MAESLKGYHHHQSLGIAKRPWLSSSSSAFLSIFFVLLFVSAALIINWVDLSKITSTSLLKSQETPLLLKCINGSSSSSSSSSSTCSPHDYPPQTLKLEDSLSSSSSSSSSCPEYFRWIHEDLKPWKSTGITRDMVEEGKSMSHLRLVIVKGKAYVQKYGKVFQTRDVFTLWGISQLLRLYPGKLPDLELLFNCGDRTVVRKTSFLQGPHETISTSSPPSSSSPPPVFHYCGDDSSFDIVFPDWTFWGWAELKIRPWETILKNIEEGNKKVKWKDRIPYAFWKGNPRVSPIRKELTKCNVSDQQDWNARIYALRWDKEIKQKFKNTKLENQCTHRYKIYAEGAAWSVSLKYILACDSMAMFIEPKYYDFYTRSLVPSQHYWPITTKNMCKDIKFAVDWGNSHAEEAQKIGKEGANYLQENLKMKLVYDYMFHLLKEYASLLRFKPKIPAEAVEVCSKIDDCTFDDTWKEFMVESMVKSPSAEPPCALPSPYEAQALQEFLQRKKSLIKEIETKGKEYWQNELDNNIRNQIKD